MEGTGFSVCGLAGRSGRKPAKPECLPCRVAFGKGWASTVGGNLDPPASGGHGTPCPYIQIAPIGALFPVVHPPAAPKPIGTARQGLMLWLRWKMLLGS